MSQETKEIFEFDVFRLDVREHQLERGDGQRVGPIPEKAFQTLVHLLRNSGSLVSKKELLAAIWPDTIVEENNLDKAIHTIRHALGEKPGQQRYVETVRKHGFRFVADVRRVDAERGDSSRDAVGAENTANVTPGISINGTIRAADSGNGVEARKVPINGYRYVDDERDGNTKELHRRNLSRAIRIAQSERRWPTFAFAAVLVALAGSAVYFVMGSRTHPQNSTIAERGTANEEAYRRYLQGMYAYERRRVEDARKAVDLFDQAIKLDPGFARAWAGKGRALRFAAGVQGTGDMAGEYAAAKLAVDHALSLDPNLSEGHSASCEHKLLYDYDLKGAERDCLRAVELQPESAIAREMYARYLSSRGRHGEAIVQIKKAVDIEPSSIFYQRNLGIGFFYARRYDEAARQLKRVIEIEGSFQPTINWLFSALQMQGKHDEAVENFLASKEQEASADQLEVYRTAYREMGWGSFLNQLISDRTLNRRNHFFDACLNAQAGLTEEAFAALERSLAAREWGIAYLDVDPRLDPLREDSRFESLIERAKVRE